MMEAKDAIDKIIKALASMEESAARFNKVMDDMYKRTYAQSVCIAAMKAVSVFHSTTNPQLFKTNYWN